MNSFTLEIECSFFKYNYLLSLYSLYLIGKLLLLPLHSLSLIGSLAAHQCRGRLTSSRLHQFGS